MELARVTTPLGRQMGCSRPEQSRWCLPGIVGEPTLQHEFVSRLQRCRQSMSCRHLRENLRGPDRNESTSDVMWKFASVV